jgi:hypothetical protein
MDTNVKQNGIAKVNNLPTLQELHHAPELAFKHDQLNLLLNQPVPEKWIKKHPFAANVTYIPIEKVEFLLTRIFQQWKAEVISYSQLFNSVACHVRLHYLNPVDGKWSFQDGLGAVGIQTNAGAAASDLTAIKQDAVMKALPAAESYAIKDAAEKLGELFGKNLNRKEVAVFSGAYSQTYDWGEIGALYEMKKKSLTADERKEAEEIIKGKIENAYSRLFKLLSAK